MGVRSLVLLPPAPSQASYENLKAAYNAPLLAVLREASLVADRSGDGIVLEIALQCPHLYGKEDIPRSTLYAPTQRLLADLYKLICVICAKSSINVEDSSGVDVRVILVAYPRDGKLQQTKSTSPEADAEGPVIDIRGLASSGRDWDTVYAVETESGEQVLRHFTKFYQLSPKVEKVRGGIVQVSSKDEIPVAADTSESKAKRKHSSVLVGGTFDHLHIGHKLLLSMTAFMLDFEPDPLSVTHSREIIVGITGDELLKNKKFAEYLESWSARQRIVDSYLRSILEFYPNGQHLIKVNEVFEPGPNGHVVHVKLPGLVLKYVEIWDPFGPSITDEAITALILSAETRSGGAAVNTKRGEKNWPALEVLEVDVLDATEEFQGDSSQEAANFESKLSSTEIRQKLSAKGIGKQKM